MTKPTESAGTRWRAQALDAQRDGDMATAEALRAQARVHEAAMYQGALDAQDAQRYRHTLRSAQQRMAEQEREAQARLQAGVKAIDDFNAQLRKTGRAGNTVPGDPI